MKQFPVLLILLLTNTLSFAQNSLVGDGFGGRLWYKPYNYTVGSYSGYAICGDKRKLFGWGNNFLGQLGTGDLNSTTTPREVQGMEQVAYFSTGYTMGAIKTDGSGWVWGSPDAIGIDPNYVWPRKVIDSVKFVDAGIHSSVFVKNDGTVWSVGLNLYGEFGDGMAWDPYSIVPIQMKNITNAVRTAQGELTTCVLLFNGEVYCAGSNSSYGLANNDPTFIAKLPIKIDNLPPLIDIKSASYGTIGLTANGDVYIWGKVDAFLSSFKTPTKITGLSNIVAISGCNDGMHFMALDNNHDCFAWGNNSFGQCGVIGLTNVDTPTKVANHVNDIMAGETFSYLVKDDGTLWASGMNNIGSIWMDDSTVQKNVFTQIHPTLPEFGLCSVTQSDTLSPWIPPVPITDTPLVFFPNAFSPNNDGLNDIFKAIIRAPDLLEQFDLKLYNRFGNKVFHTLYANQGWNGLHADVGTYFYYCTYKERGKKPVNAKGDFILLW